MAFVCFTLLKMHISLIIKIIYVHVEKFEYMEKIFLKTLPPDLTRHASNDIYVYIYIHYIYTHHIYIYTIYIYHIYIKFPLRFTAYKPEVLQVLGEPSTINCMQLFSSPLTFEYRSLSNITILKLATQTSAIRF